MSEKLEKQDETEEDGENRLFSFIVGIFITIAIMVVFVLLFNH